MEQQEKRAYRNKKKDNKLKNFLMKNEIISVSAFHDFLLKKFDITSKSRRSTIITQQVLIGRLERIPKTSYLKSKIFKGDHYDKTKHS